MIPFPVNFWGGSSGTTTEITENLVLSDSISVASLLGDQTVNIEEALLIIDALTKTAINRTVTKTLVETILLAETIMLDRPLPLVSESLVLLDALTKTAISRTQTKTLSETITLAETITLTPEPIIDSSTNVMGAVDGPCGSGRCCSNVSFSTGADCQSVQIQYSLNGGSFTAWQNMDVSPSTGGYNGSTRTVNSGDTIAWRVVPYSGDSQTGRIGTASTTNTRTCGDL